MSTTSKERLEILGGCLGQIIAVVIQTLAVACVLYMTSDTIHEMFPSYPDMSFGQAWTVVITIGAVANLFRRIEYKK